MEGRRRITRGEEPHIAVAVPLCAAHCRRTPKPMPIAVAATAARCFPSLLMHQNFVFDGGGGWESLMVTGTLNGRCVGQQWGGGKAAGAKKG